MFTVAADSALNCPEPIVLNSYYRFAINFKISSQSKAMAKHTTKNSRENAVNEHVQRYEISKRFHELYKNLPKMTIQPTPNQRFAFDYTFGM